MQKIKRNIEDILLRFLLTKNFDEIEINEIQKKTKVSSKKFFQIFLASILVDWLISNLGEEAILIFPHFEKNGYF